VFEKKHRLMTNDDISAHVTEIRMGISEQVIRGVVLREIADRQHRLNALQVRWEQLQEQLQTIIEERAAAYGGLTPGGDTGLITEHLKGIGVVMGEESLADGGNGIPAATQAKAWVKCYRVDPAIADLHRLLLEYERRAADETGQWAEKLETRLRKTDPEKPNLSKLSAIFVSRWKPAVALASVFLLMALEIFVCYQFMNPRDCLR
jgi:hypothetical protein